MKKMVKNFSFAMIILLMVAVVLTFLAPRFGWRADAVFSGSMEPELNVGGLVITRPVQVEDIKVDDIITFSSPSDSGMITHRVTGIEELGTLSFQTKGDANEDADLFTVPAQNVAGIVCFDLPYFGYASQFIKTPLGLMLTLCLPGLIIILMEMRNIWRVLTEEELEKKYRLG
ncbi:signal peptidase I [Chloroflexota bacterium]